MDENKQPPLDYEPIPVAEPAGWFHWKYVVIAVVILLVLAALLVG